MNDKINYVIIANSILKDELDSNTCDYFNPNELIKFTDLLEQFGANEESLEKLRDFAAEMFER